MINSDNRTQPLIDGQLSSNKPASPFILKSSKLRYKSHGSPPTIVEALKAQEVKQGESLHLQCLLSADPQVEYNWTKNNIPLRESQRIRYGRTDSNGLFLSIEQCRSEDSGVYMVTAKNFLGMAKISCQVLVTSLSKRDINDSYSKAAEFLTSPSDQIVKINETVILRFELRTFLDTKIIWLINGQPLKASTRFETTFDGQVAQLIIRGFQEDDSGIYTINAVSGQELSSKDVVLQIEGLSKHPDIRATKEVIEKRKYSQLNLPLIERSLKPVQSKIVRLENIAPSFVKTICNITSDIDLNTEFVAQVRGYPYPTIMWTFHGQPVPDSDRVHDEYDEQSGLIRLILNNVKPSDFGPYKLTVSNPLGTVSCSAHLYKISSPHTDDRNVGLVNNANSFEFPKLSSATIPADPNFRLQSGTDTSSFIDWRSFDRFEEADGKQVYDEDEHADLDLDKPKILKSSADISTFEGDSIIIEAIVLSTTIPKLIWLKDDGPISPSSRIQMSFNKVNGLACLQISNAVINDQGIYALVAQNQKGFVTTHCNVHVKPTSGVDTSAIVAPEKFADLDSKPIMNKRPDLVEFGVCEQSCIPNLHKLADLDKSGTNVISELVEIPKPEHKLEFVEQIADVSLSEGVSFLLSAKLNAYPIPECTWFRNGIQIEPSSKYRTDYDAFNQVALLNVSHSSIIDNGQYKLLVTNGTSKSIECTGNVKIIPVAGVDSQSKRSEAAYSNLERQQPSLNYDAGVDNSSYAKSIDQIKRIDEPKHPPESSVPEQEVMAPQLLSPLSDITITEGQLIVLQSKIHGTPMPTITWHKNSNLIEASNRTTLEYDLGSKVAALRIDHAKITDAGLYTADAVNEAGQVKTQAMVNVQPDKSIDNQSFIAESTFATLDLPKRIPVEVEAGIDVSSFVGPEKFERLEDNSYLLSRIGPAEFDEEDKYTAPVLISPLQEQIDADEQSTVQLIAIVSGYPLPDFKWTKNGAVLSVSNRTYHDYNLASKLCCLTIIGATTRDTGTYHLIASNPKGKVECSTVLNISSTGNVDAHPIIPPTAFQTLEERITRRPDSIEVIPGVDDSTMFNQQLYEAFEQQRPSHVIKVHELEKVLPRILTPLQTTLVQEGEDACLSCQLFGLPIPEIVWLKDGNPIVASSRAIIYYDILNKTAYFWIKKCSKADSGSYRMNAINHVGSTNSECNLQVIPDSKLIENTGFVSSERFIDLDKDKNDRSVQYEQIKPGVDNTSAFDESTFEKLESKPHVDIQEPIIDVQPLVISKGLDGDIQIDEHQQLHLEVTLSGHPVDEFEWLLNGVVLPASSDICQKFDPYTHTLILIIKSVIANLHDGIYEVIAKNQLGLVRQKCQVHIKPVSKIDDQSDRDSQKYRNLDVQIIERDYGESGVDNKPYTHNLSKLLAFDETHIPRDLSEPTIMDRSAPIFHGSPSIASQRVKELDNMTIVVPVSGKPIPTFYWMKDGNFLTYSNRLAMHYGILPKLLYLHIQQVQLGDSGIYYAVAENSEGSAVSDSISVNIDTIDAIDKREYRPAHLFITLDQDKQIDRDLPEYSLVDKSSNVSDSLDRIMRLDVKPSKPYDVIAGVDGTALKDPTFFKELETPKYVRTIESKDIHETRKPIFLSRITATDTVEGQNALISVMVDGWPIPKIQWIKSPDQEISTSNRISTVYDPYSKVASLLIKQCRTSDDGEYLIRCQNPSGEISESVNLGVVSDLKIDANSLISDTTRSRIDLIEAPKVLRPAYVSGVDTANYVDVNKLKELEDSRMLPRPEYSAGIDDRALVDATRFIGLDKPVHRTEFVEDDKQYRVPSVIQPLMDTTIPEGNTLCLSSLIDAYPIPSFEVWKNGKPMDTSNRVSLFYDINSKLLFIKIYSAQPHDRGTYEVKAFNVRGSSTTSCNIDVLPTESIDRGSSIPDTLSTLKAFDEKQVIGISQPIESDKVRQSPVFSDKEVHLSIAEGSHLSVPIKLSQCYPMAIFTWSKDGTPLNDANRYLHHYNMHSRILLFKMLYASLLDNGCFKVKASNEVGSDEYCIYVTIEQTPSIDRSWQSENYSNAIQSLDDHLASKPLPVTIVASVVDTSSFVPDINKFDKLDEPKPATDVQVVDKMERSAPHLSEPLYDQSANETDNVTLRFKLDKSYPACSVRWFLNGKEIAASNRIHPFEDGNTGFVSFCISKAQLGDAGCYMALIENEMGKIETKCTLSIDRVPTIDYSSKLSHDKITKLDESKLQDKHVLEKSSTDEQPLISDLAVGKLAEVEMRMHERSRNVIADQTEDLLPLRIIEQPVDKLDCIEGDSVHIQCIVTGKPLPQLIWLRNDQLVPDANRYTFHYNLLSNIAVLHIKYALSSVDTGAYTLRCVGVNNQVLQSTKCVLTVKPFDPISKQSIVASDENIRTVDNLERQAVQRKLLAYSKLIPGVDNRGFVDFDKFTNLEKQEIVLIPIVSGIDVTGNVPYERFVDLEQRSRLPVKPFTAGIDKSSNIDNITLEQLHSFDRYRMVEAYEPLTREPRMKLVHSFSKDVVNCVEGLPVSLFFTIDAYPLPEINWYRDGQLVSLAQRILSHYDPFSGIVTLHFMDVYLSDSGLYTARCANTAGSLQQQIRLLVIETRNVDETSYIRSSSSRYRILAERLEVSGKGVDCEQKDFLDFPEPKLTSPANCDVVIRYQAVGGSDADVHWLLNGVEVTEILKINQSEDGSCWFTLTDLSREQCGIYTCLVRNIFGEFSRSFTLTLRGDHTGIAQIEGRVEPRVKAPLITDELKSKIVGEGDHTEFAVEFAADVTPSISWMLNDFPIKFDDRVRSEFTSNSARIRLVDTRKSDAGWYQCTLKNEGGTSTTKAKLIVAAADVSNTVTGVPFSPRNLRSVEINKPESDTFAKWIKPPIVTETIDPAKLFYSRLRRNAETKKSIIEGSDMTDGDFYSKENKQPATFKIRLPKQLDLVEGHSCTLQATAVPINDPDMTLVWKKDGNAIQSDAHHSTTFEMGYAQLTIDSARMSDAGQYECRVVNKYGEDVSSCSLNCPYSRPIQFVSAVAEESLRKLQDLDDKSQTIQRDTQTKHFGKPTGKKEEVESLTVTMALSDVEAKEGQSLKMVAKFSGGGGHDGRIRFSWTLNNRPVISTGRFAATADGGISILAIDRVRSIDNGVLCCTARCKTGTATTSCNIKIIPSDAIPYVEMILGSAVEMNLSADEMTKMREEFRAKLMSDPAFDQAKANAMQLVRELVQDLKTKYQELSRLRPKGFTPKPQDPLLARFLKSLYRQGQPLVVSATDSVILPVRFEPSNCNVIWTKNQAVLQNSQDISIRTSKDGRSCLTIAYPELHDSGLYTAKVTNGLGSATTCVEVKVTPNGVQGAKSKLRVIPDTHTALAGGSATFACRCRQPVSWIRLDGKPIPKNRSFKKSLEQHVQCISIRKLTRDDSSTYGCKLASDNDSSAVPFTLNVISEEKPDDSGRRKSIVPSVVQSLPSQMEVSDGSAVTLSCRMQTISMNEKCVWTKDGNTVIGTVYMTDSIGELHTLQINDVTSSDAGTYMAMMESSKLQSTCNLIVKEAKVDSAIEPTGLFEKSIQSITVLEGQSAKFEFTLSSKAVKIDKLIVHWTKNNQVLSQSTDFDIWFKDGQGMLLLNKASLEDSGIYSVRLETTEKPAVPIETCSASLNVNRAL